MSAWPARLSRAPVWPNAIPFHAVIGLLLVSVAWPLSWLQISPLGQHAFFPLWVGYILTVDALVLRRKGASMLTRSPRAFLAMFAISAPLWWAFEGINRITQNWHYLGAEHYSTLQYVVLASWHFSIVVPAVFETAELVGSFGFVSRIQRRPGLPVSSGFLNGTILLGGLCLLALFAWPGYAFPATWLSLFLLLDPVNYLRGRPSIIGWLRHGDWRPVIALGVGALVCGWFWEMWNFWAMPKWEYSVGFVDFAHVFEMPLLGYAGYLPFGLEVFAGYQFLAGVFGASQRSYVQLIDSPGRA